MKVKIYQEGKYLFITKKIINNENILSKKISEI